MILADYMRKERLSRGAFAQQVGVTEEAVRLWLKGARRPNKTTMRKIEAATAGEITANDFYGIGTRAAA
jgi:DNA-binding transcriptional regulator YdaS (Cro superfamily)